MSAPSSRYTFTVTNRREHSRDVVAAETALDNVLQREEDPDEPEYDVEVNLGRVRGLPSSAAAWGIQAHDRDGALVAKATVGKSWDHDDNPDVGGLRADVDPDHRRRGLATRLIAHQVSFALALGRDRFHFGTTDRQPAGEALARDLGATVKSQSHENDLDLTSVDTGLLDNWVSQAGTRSTAYELTTLDGPVPDDVVEAYVELLDVMNTAPRDDLDVNDFKLTVEQLRDGEAYMAAEGTDIWRVVVWHSSSQQLVGLHVLGYGKDAPKTMYVGDTGVLPAHRGSALGRWMKAAMTLRVLADRPEVTTIRTRNADSNAAMLAINEAMGYRPWRRTSTWEVSREAVEHWLMAKAADLPDVSEAVQGQLPARLAGHGE